MDTEATVTGQHSTQGDRKTRTDKHFTTDQVAEIEAMITMRLVTFHEALVERGQISPPPKPDMPTEA